MEETEVARKILEWAETHQRLNSVPGVEIPPDGITQRPPIPLSALKGGEVLSQFLATLDWVIQEVRAS